MIACSTEALAVGEPLAGTAPVADAWVIIEQPGSWGSKALRDADLPDGIGSAITSAAAGTGVGVLLARHPSRTLRDRNSRDQNGMAAPHRVWVSSVHQGQEAIVHGLVEDLAEVAAWDFPAIASGSLPALEGTAPPALMLVCTQGGRDACCARIGRPLIERLLQTADQATSECIWEASHIGGHRFAPTVLALPTGAVHGRLDTEQAVRVLEATLAGEVELAGLRGRSGLGPAAQAAEIAVRERHGERDAFALTVEMPIIDAARAYVAVSHQDGRTWSVEVHQVALPSPRPESCGSEPRLGKAWQVVSVT